MADNTKAGEGKPAKMSAGGLRGSSDTLNSAAGSITVHTVELNETHRCSHRRCESWTITLFLKNKIQTDSRVFCLYFYFKKISKVTIAKF